MSFGERLSALIVSRAFAAAGYETELIDSRSLVTTNDTYGNALIDKTRTYESIRQHFTTSHPIRVITGFIGATQDGSTSTLGRGGSDLTASIFGAALDVDEIEIWTDVDGMLTADPRKVPNAFTIPEVTFEEAMELCHFGAKVIYPPTMQPAIEAGIPIRVRNTLNPSASGTRVGETAIEHNYPITGISSISAISLARLQGSGMVGVAGTAMRLFKALANSAINVILITQASSEHTICFAIGPNEAANARHAVNSEFGLEIQAGLIDPLVIEEELSIVSIVGERMRHTPGISARMFTALGTNGINVVAVAQGSSELNISAVVSSSDEVKALNAIHDEFFARGSRTLNLWIVGTGLIGGTLLRQIEEQREALSRDLGVDARIRGLANSRQMILDPHPHSDVWRSGIPDQAPAFDLSLFAQHIEESNLPNSVFVDCTASEAIPNLYPRLLQKSIPVVTSNKRGFSSSLELYHALRSSASKRRTPLLHETCVGAALPVLGTLRDLVRCGDTVSSIEAILSGTLSFIFNSIANGIPFSSAVREAKERGYTEPDPREDLPGMDVARKVLILARDAGLPLEFGDISITPMLPPEALAWGALEFMEKLSSLDHYFEGLLEEAANSNHRIFFGAHIDCVSRSARLGLQSVPHDHPFCSLQGADNLVAFTTKRYASRPLVIKGPGAGADVTAAGVFADILRGARC